MLKRLRTSRGVVVLAFLIPLAAGILLPYSALKVERCERVTGLHFDSIDAGLRHPCCKGVLSPWPTKECKTE